MTSRRGIECADLAVETRQNEAAADELGCGHDVGVGDPPGDGPIGLDGERLELGGDEDVLDPGRPEQREQRGRRTVLPARLAGGRLKAVRVESIGDDEQAGGIPVERPWIVADDRREAIRPGAARTLDPELRAAQRIGVGRDGRSEVEQGAADLRKCEDVGGRPAASPPPAGSKAAGIGDRRVPRLGGHSRGDGTAPAAVASRSAAVRSSAIGATVALARIRSVPGGTAKTVVDRPAAAHTTW